MSLKVPYVSPLTLCAPVLVVSVVSDISLDVQCAFDWSVEGTKRLPRTDESGAAVLDIFNKLKPRYKKNNVHFIPPSRPSFTYYSFYELIPTSFYFFPQYRPRISVECPTIHRLSDQTRQRQGGSLTEPTPASALCLDHMFLQRLCSPEPRTPPPPPPRQNTYMLHVCRHLG